MTLKVLLTTSTLPRWPGDAVPSFVLDQARALRSTVPGIAIEILAPHHAGAAQDEVMGGLRVHRFKYFWPESWQLLAYPAILPNLSRRRWLHLQVPFLLVAEAVAIFRHARRHQPDAIYSHWFMPQAVAGHLASRVLDIPHVFTSHSSDVEILRRIPVLGPWMVRAIMRRVHACTAVSEATYARLKGFFTNAEWSHLRHRVKIVPMGIYASALASPDSTALADARAALGLQNGPVLLFLGRLTRKKGLHVLLDSAVRLTGSGRSFTLVIAGDGELRDELEATIADLGLGSRVRMLGFVSGDRKHLCLQAADIVIVPSVPTTDGDVEGLPIALLEGMAAGKTCVATIVSGAADVMTDGVDGFLCRHGDAEALAEAIERALDMNRDLRVEMGRRASTRARSFDWPIIAEAHYRHLFADLVPRQRGGGDVTGAMSQ